MSKTCLRGLENMRCLLLVLDLSWKGEYSMIMQALRELKHEVDVAALAPDIHVNYKYDLYVEAHRYDLERLGSDYDLISIVGGYRMYYIVTNKKFPRRSLEVKLDLSILDRVIMSAAKNDRLILAPIAVPAYLAKLGLLRGKKATVYPTTDLIKILESSGAEFVNKIIVRDGNYVTMKHVVVEEIKRSLGEITETLQAATG